MKPGTEDIGTVYAWLNDKNNLRLRWFPTGQTPDEDHFVVVEFPWLWHDFVRETQEEGSFHQVEAFFKESFLSGVQGKMETSTHTLTSRIGSFLNEPDFDRLVSPLLGGVFFLGGFPEANQAIYLAGVAYGER